MLRREILSFIGTLQLLRGAEPPAEKPHSADELKELLDKEGQGLLILDVREPKEIEELGTLEGYLNIPLGEVEKRAGEIPKGKPLVVV